jgi:uncharacterized delta-60 repeat protein
MTRLRSVHPVFFAGMMVFAALGALFPATARAQAWTLDPAVAPVLVDDAPALTGTNFQALPGGDWLAFGSFTHVNGAPATHLARLRSDGSVDATFASDLSDHDYVTGAAPLADGRVLLVVRSTPYQVVPMNLDSSSGAAADQLPRVIRLRADGRKDSTFSPLVCDGGPPVLTPLPDGRVLAHGSFRAIGGAMRNGLARLNADGAVDATFAPSLTSTPLNVAATAVTANGSVVVSAVAYARNGPASYFFVRLLNNGEIDPTFSPDRIGTTYQFVAVQADGRVLAGNGDLTRYSSTGAIDRSYAVQIPQLKSITRIASLLDGRLAVQAFVGPQNALGAPAAFTVNADGQVERDLRQVPGGDEGHTLLATSTDGRLLLSQGPIVIGARYTPIRALPALAETANFAPIVAGPTIANPSLAVTAPDVSRVMPLAVTFAQRDVGSISRIEIDALGRALIAGTFTHVDSRPRPGLARFLASGALDPAFNPVSGTLLFAPPDGRPILARTTLGPLAADGFHHYENQIVRLQADGAIDPAFAFSEPSGSAQTRWLATASDGRLLIAMFDPDDAREENLKLIWLGPDGRRVATLPTAFTGFYRVYPVVMTATNAAVPPYYSFQRLNPIDAVQLVAGNKLLVAGGFSRVDGTARADLVRLNADGSLDTSYAFVAAPPSTTSSVPLTAENVAVAPAVAVFPGNQRAVPLADGRALYFHSVGTNERFEISVLRLRADGTTDTAFHPDSDFPASVQELADGSFFSNGTHYTSEGVRDRNFSPELTRSTWSGYATTAATDANGRLWIGGSFDHVNGQPRNSVARFVGSEIIGITSGPRSQTIVAGRDVLFDVVLGTNRRATFQWTHDGVPVPGATASALRLERVTAADAGVYRVLVTIGEKTFTSDAATLTVQANTSRLVNFSARSRVEPGGAPQIAGVVCAGAESRRVLLRAVGRGLPGNIGTAILPFPVLTLYDQGRAVAEDRGGATAPAITTLAQEVGAFPLNTFPFSRGAVYGSALSPALGSGAFTVKTSSGDNGAGVSLFELYDTGPLTAPPLVRNLAIRGRTAPGGEVLTAGFVIAGDSPLQVLVRGIGATLGQFGVDGAIADPRLALFSSSANMPFATNEGWAADPRIASAARRSGAFALAEDSRDAALLVTLEPGAYTAQLSSRSGASGAAMIEVYVVSEAASGNE